MKKPFLYIFLALAFVVACTQEIIPDPHPGSMEDEIVLVADSRPFGDLPDTRTIMGSVQGKEDVIMKWEPSERLGAFGPSADQNVLFTSSNTTAEMSACFLSTTATEVPQHAYYPYVEGTFPATAVPFEIPANQTFTSGSSFSSCDIKVATEIKKQSDGKYRLKFQQKLALLKVEIDLTGVPRLAPDEKIVGFEISNMDAQGMGESLDFAGQYTLDITDPQAGFKMSGFGSSAISLDFFDAPVPSSGPSVFYALVLPGKHKGWEWSCALYTDKERIVEFFNLCKCDLEPGYCYTLPVDARVIGESYHYEYDEMENATKVSGPMYYGPDGPEPDPDVNPEPEPDPNPGPDVSGETANCYMISAPGEYAFNATVIGNGDKGIIAGAPFHTTTATIAPVSASLLWQDTPDFISGIRLDASTGTIHYTANGNLGNAVIAAKDGNGNILWSWHIWGTGDTPVTDDRYLTAASNEFYVMDRNLGQNKVISSSYMADAVYVAKDNQYIYSEKAEAVQPSHFCMCYQWGRKDPVPNSCVVYDAAGNRKDYSVSGYPVHQAASEAEATIAYSVLHPDQMLDATPYLPQYTSDWIAATDDRLWGDGRVGYHKESAEWMNQKTIYDPCPAGYRVANQSTWTGFLNNGSFERTVSGGMDNKGDIEKAFNMLTAYHITPPDKFERYIPMYCNGFFFKGTPQDTKGAYYPMTGLFFGSGLYQSPESWGGLCWSSSAGANGHDSNLLKYGPFTYKVNDYNGAGNYFTVKVMHFMDRGSALPVRCVREK